MKLSILIPCFNEAHTVRSVLDKVVAVPLDIKREIIVVDDMSTDGTRVYLEGLDNGSTIRVLFHDRNLGKGAAIRTAYRYSTGDIVLIQDADLEYSPEDYCQLLEPILQQRADVVYGSRMCKGAKRKNMSVIAFLSNITLTKLTNIVIGSWNLTDVATCYKVFRRPVLETIRWQENRFAVDVELTAKASATNWRFCEVPITYIRRNRAEGKKLTWKDGFKSVYFLGKYFFSAPSFCDKHASSLFTQLTENAFLERSEKRLTRPSSRGHTAHRVRSYTDV